MLTFSACVAIWILDLFFVITQTDQRAAVYLTIPFTSIVVTTTRNDKAGLMDIIRMCHFRVKVLQFIKLTTPLTERSWSPLFRPPCRSAIPPGMIREIYIGEFCSFPPMILKPKPSSVLGSSTTRGCECPSLAAKAATVA